MKPYNVVVAEKQDPINPRSRLLLTFPSFRAASRFCDECAGSHPDLLAWVDDPIYIVDVDLGLECVTDWNNSPK